MTCPVTGAAICTCTPGKGSINDNDGHQYNIDASGNAFEDGLPMIGGSDTAKMEFVSGLVYRESTSDLWYTWNQAGAWTPAAAPVMTMNMSPSASAGALPDAATPAAPTVAAGKTPAPPPPNAGGAWSATYQLPIIAIAAALTPTGQILTWSSDAPDSYEDDIVNKPSNTLESIINIATNTATPALDTGIAADMFCPGMAMLADGQLLVDGGSSSSHTGLFNPFVAGINGPGNGTWADSSPMNIPRAYNSAVTLSNGNVFTIGGSWAGDPFQSKDGEVWSPATGKWSLTPISGNLVLGPDVVDAVLGYPDFGDDHTWLFAMPGGRVFYAGPSNQMYMFDPAAGSATPVGTRGNDPYSVNGICVMYDTGKIFKAGGAPGYGEDPETPSIAKIPATNSAYVIDLNPTYADPTADPTVTKVAPIDHARAYANGVVLPDGEVFIVGGQSRPLGLTDLNSVMTPELWNPKTMTSTDVTNMPTPRNYHSTALLLPDGRVFVGGGGACGDCGPEVGDLTRDPSVNHLDYEYYSPPYLFNADGTAAARPTITSAPSTYALGTPLTVTASPDVTSFSLVRMGSATHTIDTDQRRESVGIASNVNGNYTLAVNADPGITVPGYWMLFGFNAQGTPSVAATVKIGMPGAAAVPELANATITAQDWATGNNNALGAPALGAGSLDLTSPVPGYGLPTDPLVASLLPNLVGAGQQ